EVTISIRPPAAPLDDRLKVTATPSAPAAQPADQPTNAPATAAGAADTGVETMIDAVETRTVSPEGVTLPRATELETDPAGAEAASDSASAVNRDRAAGTAAQNEAVVETTGDDARGTPRRTTEVARPVGRSSKPAPSLPQIPIFDTSGETQAGIGITDIVPLDPEAASQ
ncbi:MAG: hypothetical protein AAFQ35_14655, partial [Pseudomonadota bacterium]